MNSSLLREMELSFFRFDASTHHVRIAHSELVENYRRKRERSRLPLLASMGRQSRSCRSFQGTW